MKILLFLILLLTTLNYPYNNFYDYWEPNSLYEYSKNNQTQYPEIIDPDNLIKNQTKIHLKIKQVESKWNSSLLFITLYKILPKYKARNRLNNENGVAFLRDFNNMYFNNSIMKKENFIFIFFGMKDNYTLITVPEKLKNNFTYYRLRKLKSFAETHKFAYRKIDPFANLIRGVPYKSIMWTIDDSYDSAFNNILDNLINFDDFLYWAIFDSIFFIMVIIIILIFVIIFCNSYFGLKEKTEPENNENYDELTEPLLH